MNKFIKQILGFSLKNKFFILFATIVVVIIGIISYRNIPIEAFPDVTNTRVIVISQWPGRSAEEIEKFVTVPIEIAMNSVQGKTDVRSITLFGLSVVTIMFEDDIKDAFARQQVNNLLGNLTLPEGVDSEIEPPYGPTGEVYRYTLFSKYRTVRELKTIQDWVLERQFKAVPGIADVVSFGGEVKAYEISIDPLLLEQYDISPLDVYQAVNKNNINVELTATKRAGFHKYTYAGTSQNNVILDLQHRDIVIDSYVEFVSNTHIRGMRRSRAWADNT